MRLTKGLLTRCMQGKFHLLLINIQPYAIFWLLVGFGKSHRGPAFDMIELYNNVTKSWLELLIFTIVNENYIVDI